LALGGSNKALREHRRILKWGESRGLLHLRRTIDHRFATSLHDTARLRHRRNVYDVALALDQLVPVSHQPSAISHFADHLTR